jgi:hypothetical protein
MGKDKYLRDDILDSNLDLTMAIKVLAMNGGGATTGCTNVQYFVCDTEAEFPSAGVNQGDLAYAKDTLKLSKRDVGVWTNTGGGAVAWGAITGTLSAQTDLQTELDAKAATTRPLNQFGSPDASVQFAQQQALQFRMENRTTDPVSPAVGEMWFRTDL